MMFDFFENNPLELEKNALILYPNFFDKTRSDKYFIDLLGSVDWQQHYLTLYGQKIPFPRLMCWMGQQGASYSFSGNTFQPLGWDSTVLSIKKELEEVLNTEFNSVLLNLYRNGQDSMSWHADDEPELGAEPIIASVSLGADRTFAWKPKYGGSSKKVTLPHGSLLVMKAHFQSQFLHALPKAKHVTHHRINLTYRFIRPKGSTTAFFIK
ncbi:2OG-Fe(II) oxygenase [Thermaurantimonas aggregans]|uniref:2OG-Fe(II) oxygenase n=1 Tax=Thermaurantimonas aggregans TaxID=2173829 RepID=A0A401XJB1_9FLAO|nr:alpha-ketoglutarate-dependent dioxygenase AlkB [Thermaurantimonas aggregans]MCX8147856.1 alpha-ketoglutarate-dependent dioxygenase AlkB [Thermaurantimonas aggregans]GCD77102.1 2OG-Fe(II) oxygenase [Thermaurantimonas aggregans]